MENKIEKEKMETVKEKIAKLLEEEKINIDGEQNFGASVSSSAGLGCGISGC